MSDKPKLTIEEAQEILTPSAFKELPHFEFPSRLDRRFFEDPRWDPAMKLWQMKYELAWPLWAALTEKLEEGGYLEQKEVLHRLDPRKKKAMAEFRFRRTLRDLQEAFTRECKRAAQLCGEDTLLKDSLLHQAELEEWGWHVSSSSEVTGNRRSEERIDLHMSAGELCKRHGISWEEAAAEAFSEHGYVSGEKTWGSVLRSARVELAFSREDEEASRNLYELIAFRVSLIANALGYYELLGYVPPWEEVRQKLEAERHETARKYALFGLALFYKDPGSYPNRSELTGDIAQKYVGARNAKSVQDKLAEAGLYSKGEGRGRPTKEEEERLLLRLIELWEEKVGNGEKWGVTLSLLAGGEGAYSLCNSHEQH